MCGGCFWDRICVKVVGLVVVFFFKQKTAYEIRISDWSSDVCSSDLGPEIMAEAEKVLGALALPVTVDLALVGGAAYAATGHPLPPETLAKAKAADALLFGAVGDPRVDTVERHLDRKSGV